MAHQAEYSESLSDITSTMSEPGMLTPTESVADDILRQRVKPAAFPTPGNTYMIVDRFNDRRLTLVDGKLIVAQTSKGSPLWTCEQWKGWLTFKNPVSGRYLGYYTWICRNNVTNLVPRCTELGSYEASELFVAQAGPRGGSILSQMKDKSLHRWCVKMEEGKEVLGLAAPGEDEFEGGALAWEFHKVDD